MTDNKKGIKDFAIDVDDISNNLNKLRGVVEMLCLVGDSHTVINRDALAYTFDMISGELLAIQKSLGSLSSRMAATEDA